MPRLEDCGNLLDYDGYLTDSNQQLYTRNYRVQVEMVIVAPKGSMCIHKGCDTETACEAIRAFMEQHKDG